MGVFLFCKFPFLLFVEDLQLIEVGQLLQQQLHGAVQFAALVIVGFEHPVHTAVLQQRGRLVLLALGVWTG